MEQKYMLEIKNIILKIYYPNSNKNNKNNNKIKR